MLAQIQEYFEDRGVTAADFPKAFIAHQFIGAAFLALTWAACYQIQPTKKPMFAPINKTFQESNNFIFVKMRQSYETVISKAERRMGQEWFLKRGIDSGRVAVSLAESTVLRKLAKPVTIPGKLWLTWKFVQAVNMGKNQSAAESGDETYASESADEAQKQPYKGRWGRRLRNSTGATADHAAGAGESSGKAGVRRGAADAEKDGQSRSGGKKRSTGERGKGLGWRLGKGGGGKRRKAACSPFGEGGPGCFVVSVRQPVHVSAAARARGRGLARTRPVRSPTSSW